MHVCSTAVRSIGCASSRHAPSIDCAASSATIWSRPRARSVPRILAARRVLKRGVRRPNVCGRVARSSVRPFANVAPTPRSACGCVRTRNRCRRRIRNACRGAASGCVPASSKSMRTCALAPRDVRSSWPRHVRPVRRTAGRRNARRPGVPRSIAWRRAGERRSRAAPNVSATARPVRVLAAMRRRLPRAWRLAEPGPFFFAYAFEERATLSSRIRSKRRAGDARPAAVAARGCSPAAACLPRRWCGSGSRRSRRATGS